MAKKDLGDIEGQNKNLGGVNALFTRSEKNNTAKEKKDDVFEDLELTNYPLRVPKSYLKKLKSLALSNDTSVKDIIISAINDKWKI